MANEKRIELRILDETGHTSLQLMGTQNVMDFLSRAENSDKFVYADGRLVRQGNEGGYTLDQLREIVGSAEKITIDRATVGG
jgi:hypothetical protein